MIAHTRVRVRHSCSTRVRRARPAYEVGVGLVVLHVHDVVVSAVAVRVAMVEQYSLEYERHKEPWVV